MPGSVDIRMAESVPYCGVAWHGYSLKNVTFLKETVVQIDSKRWTQFHTSISAELYMVCE